MNPSKAELRKEFKKRRSELSAEELAQASGEIASKVEVFCESHPSLDHFHLFFPIRKFQEIDTYLIRDFLERRHKVIYTSYVSQTLNRMETVLLENQDEFVEDRFGIPIPKNLKPIGLEKIQVVFIPLLAVDQAGNRIGYGKGLYDQFLAVLNPEVLKVGLSIFGPIPALPKESFDIPLDYCITPKKIINFSNKLSGIL